MEVSNQPNFSFLNNLKPNAVAQVEGSSMYPSIKGNVWFYETIQGVLVVADIDGLPKNQDKCGSPIHGFHIHGGNSCSGNNQDPFADAGMHYNPNNCPHPYHAGDLPPLFNANGSAFLAVLTNRFLIQDIIGKTIVIHSNPDDFTTQPAGNSGIKIACGEIKIFN